MGESRADVEMGNDEGEEPLEAEIPRVRMNPKNPTSIERNKDMKIQDTLFKGVGVLFVSKVEVLVDNIELNCWRKSKNNSDCSFRLRFLDTENATFPILLCRDSYGQTGATCCERKGPTTYFHFISCSFHQRSWLFEESF